MEPCRAQSEKPTAEQIAAVRGCAEKNQNDLTEAESREFGNGRLLSS
jgi:hypothetical protein